MITEQELTLAKKVAASTARKWRHVNREDLTQELTLWLFEHEAQVERYRAEDADGKLFVALRREAAKWAARETRAVTGKTLEADYEYSVEQVRRAMPFVFEDIPQTVTEDGTVEHSRALMVMTDFKNAFRDQPVDVQAVLTAHYRDGLTEAELARRFGVSQPTVNRRLKRAVERVWRTLNGVSS
jgi:RNA polymerase sigma factor (sigma-70 family)